VLLTDSCFKGWAGPSLLAQLTEKSIFPFVFSFLKFLAVCFSTPRLGLPLSSSLIFSVFISPSFVFLTPSPDVLEHSFWQHTPGSENVCACVDATFIFQLMLNSVFLICFETGRGFKFTTFPLSSIRL